MDLSDALQAFDDHMYRKYSGSYGPTEKRPARLDLSDKEILDWIGEYADQVVFSKGSDEYPGRWHVYCDEFPRPVSARTMREAVKLAAAKFKEINE